MSEAKLVDKFVSWFLRRHPSWRAYKEVKIGEQYADLVLAQGGNPLRLTADLMRVWAVEVKVDDWRGALDQAKGYVRACRSAVVMGTRYVPQGPFVSAGIGLFVPDFKITDAGLPGAIPSVFEQWVEPSAPSVLPGLVGGLRRSLKRRGTVTVF